MQNENKKLSSIMERAGSILRSTDGDLMFVDTSIKILACVIIGALLVALLIILFHDIISVKLVEVWEKLISIGKNYYSAVDMPTP